MKVVCPRCLARLSFNPPGRHFHGAIWFRCPNCLERFRPQSGPLPSASRSGPPLGPSGRLIRQVVGSLSLGPSQASERPWGYGLEGLPLTVGTRRKCTRAIALAVAALLAAALAAMGLGFSLSEVPEPPVPEPWTAGGDVAYADGQLLADMLWLRKDLERMRQAEKTIDYRGRESRLVKHFLGLLEPEGCRELSAIEIWSSRTAAGFQARGLCMDHGTTGTLEVDWTGDLAVIRVLGKKGAETLDLDQAR